MRADILRRRHASFHGEHRVLPRQGADASGRDLEQSGDCSSTRTDRHEHGPRGGYLRKRELDARARNKDDERYRRFRRLRPQRISLDLLLPLDPEGRQDLDDRSDGFSPRPQRAFCQDSRHGAGCGRPSRKRSSSTCGDYHRELRSSDVQGADVGLSEACLEDRRPYAA